MGVYKNENGVLTPIANETQFIAPVNEYVTKPELEAIVPSDTSADNKLVNDADVDTKINDVWKTQGYLGAKNLLPYPYKDGSSKLNFNGVNFVVDELGVLRTSGSSTAYCYYDFTDQVLTLPKGDFVLSCDCERSNRIIMAVWYRTVEPYVSTVIAQNTAKAGTSFTITQTMADEMASGNAYLFVRLLANAYSGGVDWDNLTFYPMIRVAADTDATFYPYAPTNYELMQRDYAFATKESTAALWDINNRFGFKNLLPYDYYDGDKKAILDYFLFTVNDDKSITLNGTSTATSYPYFALVFKNTAFLKKGKYILSCVEDIPSGVHVHLGLNTDPNNNDIQTYLADLTTQRKTVEFEIENDGLSVISRIMVFPNTEVNDLTLHIMLRYADDNDATWEVQPIKINDVNDKVDDLLGYNEFSMFQKWGVIGDSYSSGYIKPSASASYVTNYELSWENVLARMSGNTCYNFSHPGLMAKTWLSSEHGATALLAEDPLDLYVVCLGINDYWNATYSYGTVADVGTQADSFFGYYSQIIETIKSHAPNAKIIVSTMRNGRTGGNAQFTASQVNEAIRTIAEYYNIPCVEPSDARLFTSSYYISNMFDGHPRAVMYSAMAKAYKWLFEKAMSDYFAYFTDYIGN